MVQAGTPITKIAGFTQTSSAMIERVYGHHAPEALERAKQALAFSLMCVSHKKRGRARKPNPLISMVGATGFEPATPTPPV